MRLHLADATETAALGAALWQCLPAHCLLFLYGDLGAGKTTLLRGLLRAGGCREAVKSPTYSLVEEYLLPGGRAVYHFDLYRLKDPAELEWLGMADYLAQPALCCIEWPQMGAGWLPAADVEIHLGHLPAGRAAEIAAREPSLKNSLQLIWKNNHILL